MKKKLFFLISIFFLYFNSLIAVTYNSEPEIFIQELVDDAVKTLSNKSLTPEEKQLHYKQYWFRLFYNLAFTAATLSITGGWLYERKTIRGCGVKWDRLLAAKPLSIEISGAGFCVVSSA